MRFVPESVLTTVFREAYPFIVISKTDPVAFFLLLSLAVKITSELYFLGAGGDGEVTVVILDPKGEKETVVPMVVGIGKLFIF